MDRFTGGCLCGDLRVVALGRPYRVGLCHCLDCREHHGALFTHPRSFLGTTTYEIWTIRPESWLPPFPLTRGYVRYRDATARFEE
jgi:hypothetical protein